MKEGRIAEAIVFFEYATKFSPDNYRVWLMLARAYQKDGQSKKAIEAYKHILDNAQDEQLTGYAKEGLGSIEDRKALAAMQVQPSQLACPECGVAIPQTRNDRPWCNCGWNMKVPVTVANRIFISDIQAYCRRKSVKVSVMFRGDVVVLSAGEVGIQGIGTKIYPINPRLLFPTVHGMLCVDRQDLDKVMSKVDDQALFRERNAADDITMGRLYTWPQFLARLSEFRGYDVSAKPPDTSLAGVLASYNALDQELINDALELREENETLGQTILRLGISNFEAMIGAVVGEYRIAKPGSRPFHERLGSILTSKGSVTPVQLQEALSLQPLLKKPLGEILVAHLKACSAADLQAALKAQRSLAVMLPEADMLGELLVSRKKVTRTDMLQALADEQSKRRVPLGEVLINMGLITHQDLQSVLGWQTQKKRLIQSGLARTGEMLLAEKVITPQQLGEALKQQVMDPRPLGQVLIAKGYCTPEQVLAALESQITRRNQLAGSDPSAADEATAAPAKRGAQTAPLKGAKAASPTGRLAPATNRPTTSRLAGRASQPTVPMAAIAGVLVVLLLAAGAFFFLHGKSGEAQPPAPVKHVKAKHR